MWRLFIHKEKNSFKINIIYILLFVVYIFILQNLENNDDDTFAFYSFLMITFMVEAFRQSLFNLSYYFANSSDYSITKPVVSKLRVHLQLLSIRMDDFALYNVVYTILRLLPFIVVTLILAERMYPIYFILLFAVLFLLKAYVGPIINYITNIFVDITLNNKELSWKEKEELFYEEVKSMYPSVNITVFKVFRVVYIFSFLLLILLIYATVFKFVFAFFGWNTIVFLIAGVVVMITIFSYGLYLNHLERKQDYVLHQE